MRLFFGLPLPGEIRTATAALAAAAMPRIPGRYTLPENHHITLAFIGEVLPERLPDAARILERCASSFPAPQITLTGFSHFGRDENGILILCAQSDPPLEALHASLKAALAQAALPFDPGPFSPHITLARHADTTAGYPESALLPVRFAARQACVFLSNRDGQNILRYTPLHTVTFAAGQPDSGK